MKSFIRRIVVLLLTIEARLVLMKYRPKIVAVTGSVGKTSTKDAVYAVLSQLYFARKSEKSFNSEIGVPLTILGLPNAWSNPLGWLENLAEGFHLLISKNKYPEWLVLEVGADRPGDIKRLHWLRPHIVVYTRFPDVPVHVEFFTSPEEVIKEKCELGKALRPGGTLIVNADDEKMRNLPLKEGQRMLSYGTATEATVRGDAMQVQYDNAVPTGMMCTVSFQHEKADVRIPGVIGTHHLHPLLAALTVAISEGVAFPHAIQNGSAYVPPAGRMRLIPGVQGATIVDDSYNSSPVAVLAGLSALEEVSVPGKKIVVLGDMMELGDYSMTEHQQIGKRAVAVADVFVAVGVRMKGAAESARELKADCERIEAVQDAGEALKLVIELIGPGDVVYVKGSQSMRMERVVEGLMADQSKAPELLVRQDIEWKKR
jgi:UDP-N-acetylmuramoyl-tripeptide--D-alanyl-D-alanine ligase